MKAIKFSTLLLCSVIFATGCAQKTETPVTPPAEPTITIEAPQAEETITSPLTISGQAKGSWYFEGIFSVELTDLSGNIIATTTLQSLTNWMSEDFVPFKGKLEFAPATSGSGKLIFKNANPSGLPTNSVTYEVPVNW